MATMTVISGPERRRKWSNETREEILLAASAPGAVVTDIAKRWDICTGLIYKWRREERAKADPSGFSPVLITEGSSSTRSSGDKASIWIDMNGARVSISADASAALIATTLKALRSGSRCRLAAVFGLLQAIQICGAVCMVLRFRFKNNSNVTLISEIFIFSGVVAAI
jgi:transposase